MGDLAVFPSDAKLPDDVGALARTIDADGGAALAAYQEPLGRHWQIFAMLPMEKVMPTPYQRDLSPTHLKRMVEVMKKIGRFTEPIVAVHSDGVYWTPNGNHRRAAAEKSKAKNIPAIVIPDANVAFQILALNTEKAHNLRDKALEVIRMYRARLEQNPRAQEKEYEFEFERAHFATLGILYERNGRFSGGAYQPLLSRVDTFIAKPLKDAFEERTERAASVEHADGLVKELVAAAKKKGLTHPYLKNFIIARCNPLSRARKNMPSCKSALSSMTKALEEFDLGKIHFGQVAAAAQIVAATSVAE